MLNAIFMWIYRMDFYEVLILLVLFSGLFYAARVKFCQRKNWKFVVVLMLFVWASAVTAQTVFRRTPGTLVQPIWKPFQSYIEALKDGGQRELIRSNLMNSVLFYPAGLLLVSLFPENWRSWLKLLIVLILFAGFSFAIEYTQLRYGLGLAQTDDVIHNVMGSCVGATAFLMIPSIIQYVTVRRSAIS